HALPTRRSSDLLLVQARQPLAGRIAASSRQSRSLSVALQMSARASTAAACRAYRTKRAAAALCKGQRLQAWFSLFTLKHFIRFCEVFICSLLGCIFSVFYLFFQFS